MTTNSAVKRTRFICAFCKDKGKLSPAVGICTHDLPHPVCAECKKQTCDPQFHPVKDIETKETLQ